MKVDIRKALFPLAGHGTRFLPMTKASPKEMLPLVDKPVVQYVVEEVVAAGVSEVIMITGRGKRAIEDHFDISYELEDMLRKKGKTELLEEVRKISFLADFSYTRQKESKGLGHAVFCGRQLIGDEPFAVVLGDEVIDSPEPALSQLVRAYKRYQGPILGVQRVPKSEVSSYGIAAGRLIEPGLFEVTSLVEKPRPEEAPSDYAVIGRYVLTPDIFDILENQEPGVGGEIQLTDALRSLSGHRAIYAVEVTGNRYDTGDKLGFLKASVQFGLKNQDLGPAFRIYLEQLLAQQPAG